MPWTTARSLAEDLRQGKVSAVDVMNDVYDRIEATNPTVNAIVNLLPRDEATALASAADEVPLTDRGSLHGIPWAAKDLVAVKGFPTTMGFVPFADNIAAEDDAQAARLREAGVLFIGRTNMPEFGLGSHTFNNLFGTTRNPYDLERTCGGSSGGAAVALATRMLPFADGSDMGGSLRNPASFCNVVGLRPSMGRTPAARDGGWHARLSITGPMATSVADTAYLLAQQAGPHASDPLTLPEPGEHFLAGVNALESLAGINIALSTNLGDLPIDKEVEATITACADQMANLGATITQETPPLAGAMDVFHVQRAATLTNLGINLDHQVSNWRQHAKETAIWNIEKGQSLAAEDILSTETKRARIYAAMVAFFDKYDALILPAAQVPPFPATMDYVNEINGVPMCTYIDWMTVCCAITVTGFPAISVPGGFTSDGLPIGLQIVGKPRGDLALLQLAGCFERATRYGEQLPSVCAT